MNTDKKNSTGKVTNLPKMKIALVQISDDLILLFVWIQNDYDFTKFSLEGHITEYLGKLNSFNRIKALSALRKNNIDLVTFFKNKLISDGWDINEYPNPSCFVAKKQF